MMQTNKEAAYELARGFTLCLGIVVTALSLVVIFSPNEKQSGAKFEVVDRYKQCDVVRYTDRSNGWNFFLDCSKGRETEPPAP
jgi:hypothetical protein